MRDDETLCSICLTSRRSRTAADNGLDCDSKHHPEKTRKRRRQQVTWKRMPYLFVFLALCFSLRSTFFQSSINNGGTQNNPGQDQGMTMPSSATSRSLSRPQLASGEKQFPIVDMISIGSNTRPDYLIAQAETFGTHPSVRNFYPIMEHNDTESDCTSKVNRNKLMTITRMKCKPRARRLIGINETHHPVLFAVSHEFFGFNRLMREKKNPVGWLCAQKRPMDGLYQVLSRYRFTSQDLPDYLFVMDDDSWFNMDLLLPVLESKIEPTVPVAVAGCLISLHYPSLGDTRMQYPWGGFGTIINRATIRNLLRPLDCEGRDQSLCDWIAQDRYMEYEIFQQDRTMSILELMNRYTFYQAYSDAENWQPVGYCFHSDMVLAYFLMYATNNEWTVAFPNSTLGFQGGGGKWKMDGGQCLNKFSNCDENDIICHYISPRHMRMVHNIITTT